MDSDETFWSAIAAAPTDLTARLIYADWLDENDLPNQAEYLRLRCEILAGVRSGPQRVQLERRARIVSDVEQVDIEWLKKAAFHEAMFFIAERLGGPIPPALEPLWSKAVALGDPRYYKRHPMTFELRGVWPRALSMEAEEGSYARRAYLGRQLTYRDEVIEMFSQIVFLGTYNRRAGQFGLWRHANEADASNCPVVTFDEGRFTLAGATIQDFLSVHNHHALRPGPGGPHEWTAEEEDDFVIMRKWFAQRGVKTSRSLESAAAAIQGLPCPQARFEELQGLI